MRYAIFSDVHSNLEAFEKVLSAYAKEKIDAYLCCGDVVGYGADPAACLDIIRNRKVATVAGNHDWAVAEVIDTGFFNPVAQEAVLWTRPQLDNAAKSFLKELPLTFVNEAFTAVHATLVDPAVFDYLIDGYAAWHSFQVLKTRICFVGHTHIPGFFCINSKNQLVYSIEQNIELDPQCRYIVNVGSVGQPRDNNPDACYCVYDTEKQKIMLKRTPYDVRAARRKILEKKLPAHLGDRLLCGR